MYIDNRDANGDGNFTYKHLEIPASIRNKRRFINWASKNRFALYDSYELFINLKTLNLKNTKTLYAQFRNNSKRNQK
jgi:hypothetical protein